MKKKRRSNFEKHVEKVAGEFAKEMECALKKPEKIVFVKQADVFGIAGPLLKSILSIFLFVIVIALIQFFSRLLGSVFITSFTEFVSSLIPALFLVSLLSNYIEYFSRKNGGYWIVWPVLAGIKTFIFIWIWIQILGFLQPLVNWDFIQIASDFLGAHATEISLAVVLVCYCIVLVRNWKN